MKTFSRFLPFLVSCGLVFAGERPNILFLLADDQRPDTIGVSGNSQNQYEHTINVPLLIAGPGVKQGHITPAQVYLRELFPTTCELAGVAVPASVTSPGFAGVLKGERDTHHDQIFGYFTDAQRMIRTDQWKYIEYPRAGKSQLFDLQTDPDEIKNLVTDPARADVVAKLSEQLMNWRVEQKDPLLSKE